MANRTRIQQPRPMKLAVGDSMNGQRGGERDIEKVSVEKFSVEKSLVEKSSV